MTILHTQQIGPVEVEASMVPVVTAAGGDTAGTGWQVYVTVIAPTGERVDLVDDHMGTERAARNRARMAWGAIASTLADEQPVPVDPHQLVLQEVGP